MSTNNELKEVLVEAKRLIEHGWCRGDFKKGDRYCTLGAIYTACGAQFVKRVDKDDDYNDEIVYVPASPSGGRWFSSVEYEMSEKVYSFLNGLLGEEYDDYYDDFYGIDEWNDAQKSKKPVVKLFQKAIDRLDKSE